MSQAAATRRVMLIGEVSDRTRIPEATLRWYRAAAKDRGPKSFKLGRRIAYYEDDVETWMKEQYDAANPAA